MTCSTQRARTRKLEKKRLEFLFENLWLESQDSNAFRASNQNKKLCLQQKLYQLTRFEWFLLCLNLDVFKIDNRWLKKAY